MIFFTKFIATHHRPGFLFTFTELSFALIVVASSLPIFLVFMIPLALLYLAIFRYVRTDITIGRRNYGNNMQFLALRTGFIQD